MDIISLLSDDLLLQILSYVPTKDVVATSLLSKRWRSLWMLVPELEYNDNNHNGGYKSFSLFVYRSLLSNKAPVLESLSLSLGPRCPVADIGKWIDVAISSHSLLELTIDIRSSVEGPVRLPSCLYTSDTLETLILENCILLDVPSSVSLPSLESLHLKLIRYADNTSLTALLSGCPNLEDLYMERGSGDAMMDATIVMPSLQRLSMVDIDPGTCGRCVIDCSSLKYLTFGSDISYNFRQIEHMPALVEARVCTRRKVAPEFLKAFTSAHRLFLWLSLSEAVPPPGIFFKQLVHLDLFTVSESWWDLLVCMLQGSPKLRRLKLFEQLFEQNDGTQSGKGVPMGWKPPSSVPECLSSSLEAFKWIGYKGRLGDREMAAYFLKNAARLKTATFSPKATEVEKKYQMLKELASVPTASTSSRLLFD